MEVGSFLPLGRGCQLLAFGHADGCDTPCTAGRVPDQFSEAVFEFSKAAIGKPERFSTIASNRGVPTACSSHVRDDIARIREHERQYDPGEVGGFTFATYADLM